LDVGVDFEILILTHVASLGKVKIKSLIVKKLNLEVVQGKHRGRGDDGNRKKDTKIQKLLKKLISLGGICQKLVFQKHLWSVKVARIQKTSCTFQS